MTKAWVLRREYKYVTRSGALDGDIEKARIYLQYHEAEYFAKRIGASITEIQLDLKKS